MPIGLSCSLTSHITHFPLHPRSQKLQVLHHEQTGRIVESVLKYAAVSNDLQLYSRKDGIFMSTETMMVRVLSSKP